MQHTQQIKAMKLVLGIGLFILIAKFIAFFITHSNAIFSDALESIINVIAGAFALFSLRIAAKPKDIEHPYGHGKIEFISAGFEGGLIFIAGVFIIGKSVYNLFYPVQIHSLDVGALIAALAGGMNYVLGQYLIKIGTKHKSIVLVADGKHLQSDTISSIGLVLGVVVIYFTGLNWLDQVLAIIFGGFIIVTGYKLIRKSLAGLMDEADLQIIEHVLSVLNKNRKDNWIDIHNLRIQQYGSSFHLDCHVTLPWYHDLKKSHDELLEMETLIRNEFHEQVELFIHPDPCLPASCQICNVNPCEFRHAAKQTTVEWTLGNILKNEKHHLNS